jgi:hypothetical protein
MEIYDKVQSEILFLAIGLAVLTIAVAVLFVAFVGQNRKIEKLEKNNA